MDDEEQSPLNKGSVSSELHSSIKEYSLWLFMNTSNLPATYIYTAMVFGVFWWSRFSRKIKWMITGGIVSSFLLLGFVAWPFTAMYQKVRLLAFVNPVQYAEGEGYMMLLLQEHISKAGWFGNELNSGAIPGVHTDFVFVGFTYYFGWLAAFALVTILALFIVRIMMIARNIHEPFGKLLLVGAVALYTVQLVSNIGMTLGLFPITSISLPFISYGLMPILLNSFLIGVVLSVYRRKGLTSMRSVQSQQ